MLSTAAPSRRSAAKESVADARWAFDEGQELLRERVETAFGTLDPVLKAQTLRNTAAGEALRAANTAVELLEKLTTPGRRSAGALATVTERQRAQVDVLNRSLKVLLPDAPPVQPLGESLPAFTTALAAARTSIGEEEAQSLTLLEARTLAIMAALDAKLS